MGCLPACTRAQTKTFDELIRGAEAEDLDKGLVSEEQVLPLRLPPLGCARLCPPLPTLAALHPSGGVSKVTLSVT